MNEEWNNALDQVEDRYLQEATGYRRKVPALRIAGAAAAVLVSVVSWTFIRQGWVQPPPVIDPTQSTTEPPKSQPSDVTLQFGATGSLTPPGSTVSGTGSLLPESLPPSAGGNEYTAIPENEGNEGSESHPLPPAEWMDLSEATLLTSCPSAEGIITAIGEDHFYFTTIDEPPLEFWVSGDIGEDWCVGDRAYITCEQVYYHPDTQRYAGTLTGIYPPADEQLAVPEKPVIYLYPETRQTVRVTLELKGRLTCTYPAYNQGWTVIADPDGTLTDELGLQYNYLYWEGITEQHYDFSKGFCIPGSDTAAFLEEALPQLGLNRREANEFIVYWLPLMEQNPYNIITFQQEAYRDTAALEITPTPDTLIRVFMAWKSSDSYVNLQPQPLTAPERTGFTAVEWGGAQLAP